jgi:hypothetical protein
MPALDLAFWPLAAAFAGAQRAVKRNSAKTKRIAFSLLQTRDTIVRVLGELLFPRSIRRRLTLSLGLRRFNPPHEIVGKARESPFDYHSALADRLSFS